MNRLTIIGNLTKDPEFRTTATGLSVCSFTVAVNRRKGKGQESEADYFRVTAWRELGENCAKFLRKGRKVAVVGSVSVSTYNGHDGKTYANLEVLASDVEFLSSANDQAKEAGIMPDDTPQEPVDPKSGLQQVNDEELPF